MARRLRLQFPGARYHIINRGNFRQAVFSSDGAWEAFVAALGEAADRFRWRVHAYAVMSNHYHLALDTPEPNLATGMHWLQSTYATRHNRFRRRHGHLFQGRFKSLLIEDAAHLARVVDYIHLNPARAGIVTPDQLTEFKPSSLGDFLTSGLTPSGWPHVDQLLASVKSCPAIWPKR
jgi:REP element-mobilizing transposase RayT